MLNFLSRKPYRLGLALSGGGARGFAHIGALKALQEHGIHPDVVAGVSAGSVVAVLYASGIAPDRMLELFRNVKFGNLAELKMPRDGFFCLDRFKKFILDSVGVERLEDLKIPTIIGVTDLHRGVPVAFAKGPLGDIVMASCSIPIVFKPVRIGQTDYVDGGVLHNLPAWALRDKCSRLIGINCSPLRANPYRGTLPDIAQRTYSLMARANAVADMALCDLTVETTEIADHQVFNLKEIEHVYRSGYDATETALRDAGWIK